MPRWPLPTLGTKLHSSSTTNLGVSSFNPFQAGHARPKDQPVSPGKAAQNPGRIELDDVVDFGELVAQPNIKGLRITRVEEPLRGVVWTDSDLIVSIFVHHPCEAGVNTLQGFECASTKLARTFSIQAEELQDLAWIDADTFGLVFLVGVTFIFI